MGRFSDVADSGEERSGWPPSATTERFLLATSALVSPFDT
jgi:hypothetical protein